MVAGRGIMSEITIRQRQAEKVCYNELGDLYLDKLNKHDLTQNLVHRLERLGYTVTLEQRAADAQLRPPAEPYFHSSVLIRQRFTSGSRHSGTIRGGFANPLRRAHYLRHPRYLTESVMTIQEFRE